MMERARRTRILIEGEPALMERMAADIERTYAVSIVKAPEKSLVMCKARDSVSGQPFYLTEMLATECTVSVEGAIGFGILMGSRPDQAFQLAVIDAAAKLRLAETAGWQPLLLAEENAIRQKHLRERQLVRQTKVQFETMEEAYGNG